MPITNENRTFVGVSLATPGLATAHSRRLRTWQPSKPKDKTEKPSARKLPALFYSATRDSKTGSIHLKVVNTAATEQAVRIEVKGARVAEKGLWVVLKSASTEGTNSINEPRNIILSTSKVSGLGNRFTQTLAPNSINVLQLESNNLP